MKKVNVVSVSLIILLLISSALFSEGRGMKRIEMNPMPVSGSDSNFKELIIRTKSYEVPMEMPIYTVIDKKLKKSDMNELMKKFGVDSEIVESNGEFTSYAKEGKSTLIYDKRTGSINYFLPGVANLKPIENELSDEEYRKLAENFLTDKDLLGDEYYYKSILKHEVGKSEDDKATCLVEVVFTTDLDGVKYSGVGPKVCVFFRRKRLNRRHVLYY